MKVSKRISGLTGGGSDGWDLYRRSKAMIAQGVDVIELTIGEHDRRTEPEILTAMYEAAMAGHTGYAAIPGTDALRDAIAERTERLTGVATARDNVVVMPGGQAALFASHVATCDPGDVALYIDPYYATYPGTIRGTGAVAQPVAARAEHGFQPQASDIASHAHGARSLLINSPNNPTGVVYNADTMNGIARTCMENDLWLISDEVYDSQIWSGSHLSPRQLPEVADRTLVIGSLSKSHAMTGSRMGWIVGPVEAIDHLINLTTHTTYGCPGFLQDAGLFALQQGPGFEEKISAPFRRRHAATLAVLSSGGVPVVPSSATMYLMADIRATGMSGESFADHLLDTAHIAVMPGESFGQAAAGHIRIALTVEDSRLLSAAERIADTVHTLAEAAA